MSEFPDDYPRMDDPHKDAWMDRDFYCYDMSDDELHDFDDADSGTNNTIRWV